MTEEERRKLHQYILAQGLQEPDQGTGAGNPYVPSNQEIAQQGNSSGGGMGGDGMAMNFIPEAGAGGRGAAAAGAGAAAAGAAAAGGAACPGGGGACP